jgi:pimeloyl-ACP methyl ester carboxylesterase
MGSRGLMPAVLLAHCLTACGHDLVRPAAFDWNPALELRTVQLREGTVLYAVAGEGLPVLLLHGFGGQVWVWEKQIPSLSKHYRLYVPDLLGHGYSDRPSVQYTPAFFVASIRQFMDRLGIQRASVIGNSMGGGIAWAYAVTHPERIDKLVLIDSIPPDVVPAVRNRSFRWLLAIRRLPLLPELSVAMQTRGLLRMTLEEMVYDDSLITGAVVERQYRIGRIAGTPRAMISMARQVSAVKQYAPALARLGTPTLIIWGRDDEVFPVQVGRDLHELIPGSAFIVIPDSGHMPMWETPDEVNREIAAFLKR